VPATFAWIKQLIMGRQVRTSEQSTGLAVIVPDRRNHLFQPLLYKVATVALSLDDIASPIRGILASRVGSRC